MQIGELSARTGVSRRSLRYYEQHELVRSRRTGNGWRVYDEAAVHRVRRIAELIGKGMTVEGITSLEPCLERHELSHCDDPTLALETYRARLAVLDDRLAGLQRHRDQLVQSLQPSRRSARIPTSPRPRHKRRGWRRRTSPP